MRPNPWDDFAAFMTKLAWYTPVYWLLLIGALVLAVAAWRRMPAQRSARNVGILVVRLHSVKVESSAVMQQPFEFILPREGPLHA